MTATQTGDGREHRGSDGTGVTRLSTATRLAFLGGPMLSMIDSSVVNIAVPDIVTSLHTSLGTAAWTVSGYLLGLATGLAATPWLARRFGTLPAYQAALAGFIAASACCALAPNVTVLIAMRVLQGLAGAPMVPLAMGLLLGKGTGGVRTMPVSAGLLLFAAPALGPAIGGLLISGFGWRSVFLINLPVGIAAWAGVRPARRALAASGDRGARLDLAGLLLLAAGLALATYGASEGPGRGWLSAAAAPAWTGGLALIAGYLLWARRGAKSDRPSAVSLSLLTSPLRSVTLALACVASVVLFAVLFLVPVFLTDVQHRPAAVTGLVLLPQGIVMGLASWLGNAVVERGRARPAVIACSVSAGLALLAASTAGLALLTAQTPAWLTAVLLCGRGVALGLTVQPLVLGLLGDLDDARLPDANTLFNIAERLSGSFGIALLATFYTARAEITGSAVTALHDCALLLAAVSAGGALAALMLRGRARGPDPWLEPAPGPGS
ncbi:MAG TPA: MFS transporter [Streptosporangiaceae bacterium]|nr:MFS transporter [Streptosporangiaceae bacterium]